MPSRLIKSQKYQLSSRSSKAKGQAFDEIQMDLFEFLKLKPLDFLKGKDLQGPLKFLRPKASDTQPSSIHPTSPSTAVENSQKIAPRQEYQHKEPPTCQILGFPTQIKREAYLRYIRFHLQPNGILHVTAPKNRPLDLIAQEVSEYKDWILSRHEEYEHIRKKFPALVWQNGHSFPFLGQNFKLRLQGFSAKKASLQFDLDELLFFYPETWSQLPSTETSSRLKMELLKFYKMKSCMHLHQRTRYWAEQMQLFPRKLTFRNQKTRWGSCSSQGQISFNWRLVAYPSDWIDYIIIHELAHLQHQNHSQRFWHLVGKFSPNYKILRQNLRDYQFFADFLAPQSELYLENPQFPTPILSGPTDRLTPNPKDLESEKLDPVQDRNDLTQVYFTDLIQTKEPNL